MGPLSVFSWTQLNLAFPCLKRKRSGYITSKGGAGVMHLQCVPFTLAPHVTNTSFSFSASEALLASGHYTLTSICIG